MSFRKKVCISFIVALLFGGCSDDINPPGVDAMDFPDEERPKPPKLSTMRVEGIYLGLSNLYGEAFNCSYGSGIGSSFSGYVEELNTKVPKIPIGNGEFIPCDEVDNQTDKWIIDNCRIHSIGGTVWYFVDHNIDLNKPPWDNEDSDVVDEELGYSEVFISKSGQEQAVSGSTEEVGVENGGAPKVELSVSESGQIRVTVRSVGEIRKKEYWKNKPIGLYQISIDGLEYFGCTLDFAIFHAELGYVWE